jgi:hypothetical protein
MTDRPGVDGHAFFEWKPQLRKENRREICEVECQGAGDDPEART